MLRFRACDPPTDDEMDRLPGTIARRLDRLPRRRSVVEAVGDDGEADRWCEEARCSPGSRPRPCRAASLTPRPRINLLLYYGVLGARSAWRSRIAAPDRAASNTPPAMAGPLCGR
ncbi:MAG TPA: hypothetical protein VNI78_13440, partial [Vicinamibacterales bacterium]|nr:hypothetical protein [Vicinamibacterales bacterium]